MNQQIDIVKLDINQLKALAYDQVVELNRLQQNLQKIETRIIQLGQEAQVKEMDKKK